MDHSVKPPSPSSSEMQDALRKLSDSLLSPSRIEGAAGRSPSDASDPRRILEALSALGDIARTSLQRELQAEEPSDSSLADAIAAPAEPAPEVPEKHRGAGTSSPDVIEALLRYHRERAPAFGARMSPKPSANAKAGAGKKGFQKESIPSEFASAEIPIVDARPKSPASFSRPDAATTTVLRSKDRK